jgi:hypothetical protein
MACAVVCAGWPVAAQGATPLRPIASTDVDTLHGDEGLTVVSDEHRWYVYRPEPGFAVAVDDRTGRRLELDVGQHCRTPDVRYGLLLLECWDEPTVRLLSLFTGATTVYPQQEPASGLGPVRGDGFGEIGRYWLAGSNCLYGRCGEEYLNRETRELRGTSSNEEYSNFLGFDIDTPDLALSTKTGRVDESAGGYTLRQYEDEPDAPLYLLHGRRRTRIASCHFDCNYATLGGGVSTWHEGRWLRAYSLRTRRRTSWRLPPVAIAAVVHTSRFVLARTTEAGAGPTGLHETLYRASIPKRR